MEYLIKPFIGVGAIRFGMSKDEARKMIGVKYRYIEEQNKYDNVLNKYDEFKTIGITITYNNNDLIKLIHFEFPYNFDIDNSFMNVNEKYAFPVLEDTNLFTLTHKNVKSWMEGKDKEVKIRGNYLISCKYGIELPCKYDEPEYFDKFIEDVNVYSKDEFLFFNNRFWHFTDFP